MTLEQFFKINTKINEGENLSNEFLTSIYESIKEKEFSTPTRGTYLSDYNECSNLFITLRDVD